LEIKKGYLRPDKRKGKTLQKEGRLCMTLQNTIGQVGLHWLAVQTALGPI